MRKLGEQTVAGLSEGMTKSSPAVASAASGVGKDAFHAMKKSISGLSDLLVMDTDLNPTITPVLDLTAFHKEAGQISSTLSDHMIDVDSSIAKAKYASSGYQANVAVKTPVDERDISSPAALTFIQNNNSPKALSSAEIYRQTQNQLSLTKRRINYPIPKEL
ncbi:MAG: hypothetical protein LC687_00930 [Actinobacteria bacterium]|nr:hypothetical protein [Actinomycetota bacterium]